jgi:hypothetical protein
MNTTNKVSRVLGLAFLLQFITSVSSGSFIRPLWLVPDDIRATMLKIAENPNLLRVNILVDMLTALGVIFLGAILFITLRKQNEKIALTPYFCAKIRQFNLIMQKQAILTQVEMPEQYLSKQTRRLSAFCF